MLYDYIQFSSYLVGLPCHGSTLDNQSLHSLQGKWHCSLPNDAYFYRGKKIPFPKNLQQFPNQWLWQINTENIKFLTRSILFLFIWSLWYHKWFIVSLLIWGIANVDYNDFIVSKTLILFIIISIKHITNDWYLFKNNSILISCNLLPGNKSEHDMKNEKRKKNPRIAETIKKKTTAMKNKQLKFLTGIYQQSKIRGQYIRTSSLVLNLKILMNEWMKIIGHWRPCPVSPSPNGVWQLLVHFFIYSLFCHTTKSFWSVTIPSYLYCLVARYLAHWRC